MPWGHLAVACFPYAGYRLARDGRLPGREPLLVLLFASQFPDLVDKPLAWTLGVLPSGRMLAHSVVLAAPFVLAVGLLAWRLGRAELGAAFALGHLSHLYADFYPLVRQGADYHLLPNLFWPLVPANPDLEPGFLVHFERVEPSPAVLAALGLLVLAWALAGPAGRGRRRSARE